ncbi:hypothetical protein GCM10023185_40430 [Hymenobacter saemangeumensis]|uniref:Uncharacterized protein n=1 Tax=Hymenobacter saemangeumensis TaxID=1084522 RepID=A0ABP8IR14_9BACT
MVACTSGPALAQIVREKPGKVKAANRRALREARKTEVPYKDTHLDVSKDRLKRGSSEPKATQHSNKLDYKHGIAPNVKEPGIFGLRRKKKL